MVSAKSSAAFAPEVDLRNPSPADIKAGIHPGFIPGQKKLEERYQLPHKKDQCVTTFSLKIGSGNFRSIN